MATSVERLPDRVWSAAQVRELERLAIEGGVPDYELMCRAGAAALRVLHTRWPAARSIAVVCGAGNNAGDGLVVARLARAAGLSVQTLLLVPPERLKGAAAQAVAACRAAGVPLAAYDARALPSADVVVDGASVGAVASYSFNGITANHQLQASFGTNAVPSAFALVLPADNDTIAEGALGAAGFSWRASGDADAGESARVAAQAAVRPRGPAAAAERRVALPVAVRAVVAWAARGRFRQ